MLQLYKPKIRPKTVAPGHFSCIPCSLLNGMKEYRFTRGPTDPFACATIVCHLASKIHSNIEICTSFVLTVSNLEDTQRGKSRGSNYIQSHSKTGFLRSLRPHCNRLSRTLGPDTFCPWSNIAYLKFGHSMTQETAWKARKWPLYNMSDAV
jgi:hypothetical protein